MADKVFVTRMIVVCETCNQKVAEGEMSDPYDDMSAVMPLATEASIRDHYEKTGHLTARAAQQLMLVAGES